MTHAQSSSAHSGSNGKRRGFPFQYTLGTLLLISFAIAVSLFLGFYRSVLVVILVSVGYLMFKNRMGAAAMIVVAFATVTLLGLGTLVEVRLNTGEQRRLLWGIPIHYRPVHGPMGKATKFLADPHVPDRWVWCATQVGSNNADAMVAQMYAEAATWIEVDPRIAQLLVRDMAKYTQETHAMYGLPEGEYLMSFAIERKDGQARVKSNWKTDPEVRRYLTNRGYQIP